MSNKTELSNKYEILRPLNLDDYTKKKIKKLSNEYKNMCVYCKEYFDKLFEIIHKDILNLSNELYYDYLNKTTEINNEIKKLYEHKNEYDFETYTTKLKKLISDKEMYKLKITDGYRNYFLHLGKSKFLIDNDIKNEEQLYKQQKYLIIYFM